MKKCCNFGDLVIRMGLGLLFIWGGLEKFFEGFLGGVGLDNMAGFLKTIGFGFLGDDLLFVLAIAIAGVELIAGILLIVNQFKFYAYGALAIILAVALFTVYLPALLMDVSVNAAWVNVVLHFTIIMTLIGLTLKECSMKCCK